MVKSRPYVILSAAITLDGKLGVKNKRTKLSSKNDKIRVHKLRSIVDAIIKASFEDLKKENMYIFKKFKETNI